MSRLSNAVREQMARALVDHRFAEQREQLTRQSRALFNALHEHHHSTAVRRSMDAIEREHTRGFDRRDELRANVGGVRIDVGAINLAHRWKVEVAKRTVLDDCTGYDGIGVDPATDLGELLMAFHMSHQELRDSVKIAEKEALGALSQFTTGKKLAAEWPDAMPVIGDLIPEDDRSVPVVQVGRLNDKFKLPPANA